MDVRPIVTESDYEWALAEVAPYFDNEPAPGTEAAARFTVLSILIGAYEDKQWRIEAPDPIDAVRAVMQQRYLKQSGPAEGSLRPSASVDSPDRPITGKHPTLVERLRQRYGTALNVPPDLKTVATLEQLASHRSCRAFKPAPVPLDLQETLCAIALSAPSKSDLQQRDIIIVQNPALRRALEALMPSVDWLPGAPALLIICGNNRRQRRLHELRQHAFANDHLDAFFNATADAAIALAWLVVAAEAADLGCCPISAVRNEAAQVSALLHLPDFVFPFAGLALGWPAAAQPLNPRLPLAATVHFDSFDDTDLPVHVTDTDARRRAQKPFARQRFAGDLGTDENYSWSEDVTRQYARSERADFGAYVRARGFKLD